MTYKTGLWGEQAQARSKRRLEYFKNKNVSFLRNYKLLRETVLTKFGKKCNKCGFNDIRALQIDHVNNNGSDERRKKIAGITLLGRALKNKNNEYQLLCANCNTIKRFENLNRKEE